jgi:glutamyl/glutaminyl-tRNA synthetase
MTTYHPWLTLGRVTDDHEIGVTEFFRGADLFPECQLYDHLARQLYGEGYRILQEYGYTIVDPKFDRICSKSESAGSIADYREAGVSSDQIMEALTDLEDMTGAYGASCTQYMKVKEEHLIVRSPDDGIELAE